MSDFLKRFLANGLPGWVWAGLITATVLTQEIRGELSTQFTSYAGAVLTVWLGYRWVKNGSPPPEKPKD